jgi:hypothetical protein
MREQAIAEYHDLLVSDRSLNSELFDRMRTAMAVSRLLYGERELGVALRPHLLTRAQYDLLAHRAQLVVGAFDKVAEGVLANPGLMEGLGLGDVERRLAMAHPGYSQPAITTRLDAFVYDDEVKFVEYNAENPSSLTDQAGLNQVLFEVPALWAFSERYRLRQFNPEAGLLEALLATYREWGGNGTPHIAILDWKDLPTATEFILLRNYFIGCGIPTIICSPEELEYSGGNLRRGAFAIDLVYKRVIIHEFLARYDENHPLVRAYLNKDVCLVNPFRCKLLHKKASFELLTDETYARWFTPEQREAIRQSVPWTRRFTDRATQYRGRTIELVEYARQHRHGFILKPNDDYGGRGISIGNRSSEADWDAAISNALAGDYVVQELIDLRTEEFPIFRDDRWGLQPMFVDTNPFLFRGRVQGAMVRLSDSPIVNVTSGGGETGFFVIEGEIGR